jgi:hypothetical protein
MVNGHLDIGLKYIKMYLAGIKKTYPSCTNNQKRKQNKVLKDKGSVKGDAKRILSAK